MIDDSALFHGTYDPVKAREYYLRTRKLKGRRPAALKTTDSRAEFKKHATGNEGRFARPQKASAKSRRAELQAQKEALKKRLDRLRDVLEQLVADAKKRSGVKKPKEDEKDKAPETKADKADRNKAEKDRKPLTAKQKSDKAKKAKEAYEKEHPNSLSQDVEILQEQVKDIQAKIHKAIEDARERSDKAGKPQASFVRSPNKRNDGPRGR